MQLCEKKKKVHRPPYGLSHPPLSPLSPLRSSVPSSFPPFPVHHHLNCILYLIYLLSTSCFPPFSVTDRSCLLHVGLSRLIGTGTGTRLLITDPIHTGIPDIIAQATTTTTTMMMMMIHVVSEGGCQAGAPSSWTRHHRP